MRLIRAFIFVLFVFAAGCADMELPIPAGAPQTPVAEPNPGAPQTRRQIFDSAFQTEPEDDLPRMNVHETLHFSIHGWSIQQMADVGQACEAVYRKIMFDMNLLSFKPRENYRVTIYRDQQEYQERTGYPGWSGGGTVTQMLGAVLPSERQQRARTSIVTYETAVSPPLLAHEICHLVFNEFMNFGDNETARKVFWLNEGLATYEEMEARPAAEKSEYVGITRSLLRSHRLPLNEAVSVRPMELRQELLGSYFFGGRTYQYTNIDIWYWQMRDVTEFLIRKKGNYNFFLLLNALKNGRDINGALSEAYPGMWRNLSDLEAEWKSSL